MSDKRIALVDGDFIAYRCAASCEPAKSRPGSVLEPEYVACGRATDICERIGDRIAPTEFRIFLGGDRNFRKQLDPSYKANRLDKPPPTHLAAVRDFLVRKWGAQIVTEAYEVDDKLGILAAPGTVICSIDKDLRQIPGEHYNPVKDTFEVVDDLGAALSLYTSMLVGDTSDNLRGIDGLGPVKSGRLLQGLSAEEAHLKVQAIYADHGRDFFQAYRLYRLLRSEEEYHEIMAELELENIFGESQGPEATTVGTGSVVGSIPQPHTQ